ncbi:MAG: SAM-dependent methyltransferase [Oscillospiraceae bacterium]|nr:SAM-dependent methyltransferase [Oscillospiraceae bacterium]
MNRRLSQLFDLLPKAGKGIIDIGTDHGMIPIRLAQSGYPGRILASDIVQGPLNTAIEAAAACGLEGHIDFLLCDGLERCPPNAVDTILIAGMGGDTICGILDRAEWLFSAPYRLVLQPMTRAEVVRYWLIHNEYRIEKEAVISEDQHVYQMFAAIPGKNESMEDAEYLVGSMKIPHFGDSPILLIERQIELTEKKLSGLSMASDERSPTYLFYTGIRNQLNRMKQELAE